MDDERQAPEDAGAPDASPDPGLAVRRVVRATEAANQALARRLGIGLTDLGALDHLLFDGPLGPVELGERVGLRSASATALVDRLEAAGHVRRRPHPTDRRRLAVVPTDHAREETLAALEPLLEGIRAAGADLTPGERRLIAGYLDRLAAVLRAYR